MLLFISIFNIFFSNIIYANIRLKFAGVLGGTYYGRKHNYKPRAFGERV